MRWSILLFVFLLAYNARPQVKVHPSFQDSLFSPGKTIKWNPTQLVDGELRLEVEKRMKHKHAIEIGGSVIYPGSLFNFLGNYLQSGGKLTVGHRYYVTRNAFAPFYSIHYLKIMLFGKYVHYTSRSCDENAAINDPISYFYTQSLQDREYYRYNERKIASGLQVLFGTTKRMNDRWVRDFYCGLGIRYRHRIILKTEGEDIYHNWVTFNPPVKQVKTSIMPSVHLGFNIGIISFKK